MSVDSNSQIYSSRYFVLRDGILIEGDGCSYHPHSSAAFGFPNEKMHCIQLNFNSHEERRGGGVKREKMFSVFNTFSCPFSYFNMDALLK